MVMLSLDLDFFQGKPIIDAASDSRPSRSDVEGVWKVDEVERFLAERCCLSKGHRIPGRSAKTHDEAFHYWRSLLVSGSLEQPFDVVHIDAHPDLGLGSYKWQEEVFLEDHSAPRPVWQHSTPKHLDEGNFLIYAISCRWLRSLTWIGSGPDKAALEELLPVQRASIWKNYPADGHGSIALPVVPASEWREWEGQASRREPPVEYQFMPSSKFSPSAPPDFAFFCHSPRYTAPEADALIPIVEAYLALT